MGTRVEYEGVSRRKGYVGMEGEGTEEMGGGARVEGKGGEGGGQKESHDLLPRDEKVPLCPCLPFQSVVVPIKRGGAFSHIQFLSNIITRE